MRTDLTHAQQDAIARMREVLQDGFLTLRVQTYQVEEDVDAGRSAVLATIIEDPGDIRFVVEANGVGMIDALFSGLLDRYAGDHPSLRSIRFTGFSVRGLMTDTERGADAQAEAEIEVTNSYGATFTFGARSHSVSRASLEIVVAAVEYFVNAERAWVKMYEALQHYRGEGRTDLVQKYTAFLAEMVKNTSYSEVIEQLRAEG